MAYVNLHSRYENNPGTQSYSISSSRVATMQDVEKVSKRKQLQKSLSKQRIVQSATSIACSSHASTSWNQEVSFCSGWVLGWYSSVHGVHYMESYPFVIVPSSLFLSLSLCFYLSGIRDWRGVYQDRNWWSFRKWSCVRIWRWTRDASWATIPHWFTSIFQLFHQNRESIANDKLSYSRAR